MSNPSAVGQLLVEKADGATAGYSERHIRRIGDGGIGQVRGGPGHAAVRRAANVKGVNVTVANAVGPANVDDGAVIGIDGDGERRADTFLPKRRGIGPRNRNTLNYEATGQVVRRIL